MALVCDDAMSVESRRHGSLWGCQGKDEDRPDSEEEKQQSYEDELFNHGFISSVSQAIKLFLPFSGSIIIDLLIVSAGMGING